MTTIREVNRLADEKQAEIRARHTAWTSPYTADPAAYGLAPVEIVQYDGRRFRVCPPGRCGGLWEWQEVGSAEVYSASSMRMAFLFIGAYCALTRGK